MLWWAFNAEQLYRALEAWRQRALAAGVDDVDCIKDQVIVREFLNSQEARQGKLIGGE